MMKLTEDQKEIIAMPVVFAMWLSSVVIPIVMACMAENPAWLLLWIAGAAISGVIGAALKGWINR